MRRKLGQGLMIATLAAGASIMPAVAEQAQSVQGLLSEDFTVVGTVPSPDGPGLFLQKKERLFFCLVAETRGSAEVTTRYCKPVK